MNLSNFSEEQKLEIYQWLFSLEYETVKYFKNDIIQQKTIYNPAAINSKLFEFGEFFKKRRQETKSDKYLLKNMLKNGINL